ncbi:T9SS type A sorting domain-containing protein [Neolewinella lacunae]|uniref:T9SS type A sorting domain-containing protein n=1 Tax=Neolewinella lacunae TaxID=1517758 RepID=A0A923T8S6_9BACT|nr:T9SS type A sorting domain-containing protein [Neolewinella lacunae]MBC6994288.1 T9SS type A sorting domain-containing protein [Neolewinella lacunae]MDN3635334.1 T9SS type A sorting domain-containing protein [Neolewinella lacunae]
MRTANGDPVLLFVGDNTFGNFASYNGPENSRLNFRIAEAGETVYFGMSRLFRSDGTPESFGQYKYRVRSAADGSIVFGPITVNANSENLATFEQAELGPAVLQAGGYPTNASSTFVAPAAGEYFIEFDQTSPTRARYIGLWDITIANNGEVKSGRIYSKNWAFRVPELDPQLPECAFGAELSTVFYSYTADGFVTRIDFRDSGFQPLSFNLAFNRTGPGESGNLALDRRSIANANATANAAEHLIFLEAPDADLFPDGQCGNVAVNSGLRCQADNTFCIPVSVTLPGQVEITLDFNGNGVYDPSTDRILVYSFQAGSDLSACIPWDGRLANGERPNQGAIVDILVEYTQGVQHWALYDGELMRNGFCVTPVRPLCNQDATTPLFYDDINIPEESGTGAPKQVLDGCACRTGNCRTWTNFDANAADDCTIDDSETTGYGDRNTLNTWWYASVRATAAFNIPLNIAMIQGPTEHCPGDPVVLRLNYSSDSEVASIRWTGPAGPINDGNDQTSITAEATGMYTVVVVDVFGCASSGSFTLMDYVCTLNVNVIGVTCQDGGTDTDPSDDVFFAQIRVDGDLSNGYLYNGIARNYGEVIEIGPFFIMDGNATFTATDLIADCCTESVTIPAPPACSDGCAITTINILETACQNNGTLTDPADDSFTFTLIVDGINLSNEWVNNRGERGHYGVPVTFGPYLIADGPLNLRFTDSADASCGWATTVQPPLSCSNECLLMPAVENLLCSDNGTPFDPSDDTYTFNLLVMGENTPSVGYQVNGNGAYLYGQSYSLGPFPTATSDYLLRIVDLGNNSCSLEYPIDDLSAGCSSACGIRIADAIVTCDEGDDGAALFVELLVESQNPGATSWRTSDGQVGNFGEYTRVATLNPGGATLTLTVEDSNLADCTASVTVTSPGIAVVCPANLAQIGHPASLQSFGGTLTSGSRVVSGAEEVCWMGDETRDAGQRYLERYSLRRTDSLDAAPRLFSFYLYGPEGSDLRGAVFSQPAEAMPDCCNLTNDGPVFANPTNPWSLPTLPDSLVPQGLVLQQRFSVVLRPQNVYALTTSSRRVGQVGDFRWLILSADREPLLIDQPNVIAPVVTFRNIQATYDLLTPEAGLFLDQATSLAIFGQPQLDSLCGLPDLSFSDTLHGTCDSALIVRTFQLAVADTVVDALCTQHIDFRALALADISWPESQLRFGCGETFPMLPNTHPTPGYTGFPFVYRAGRAVALDAERLDNLRTSYTDVATLREDGGTDIRRTWTVVDECRNATATYTQLLKLESNGIPFFSCPISNHYCPIVEEDIMLWRVGQFDCFAEITIPRPEIFNVCDSTDWVFRTEFLRLAANGDTVLVLTLADGDDRVVREVPPGEYLIRYSGTHASETIEARYCRLRVADLTEPVAVCKSTVNLSVPGSGTILVPFQVINQGSYDNCGIVLREMRRRVIYATAHGDSLGWSAWTERLLFDCEDVGLDLAAQIRVTDAAGLQNLCTSVVTVRDNTEPYCTGLESVSISCDDLPNNFSAYDTVQLRLLFGMPDVVDNCSAQAIELAPLVTGSSCAPERIRRRFRAVDQHGNHSAGVFIQDIFVTPSLAYAIRLPKDAVTDCTDLVDTVLVRGAGCDSITLSFVDIALPVTGDECRYLQRNYVITNWCEWDGISEPIRIGRDEDCDGTEGDADTWLVRTPEGIFVDADSLSNNNFPLAAARGSSCGAPNPAGYWRQVTGQAGGRYVYSQRIKIVDTVAPVLTLTMFDTICADTVFCRKAVTVGIWVDDACQVAEGQVLIGIDFGNTGTIEATSAQTGTLTGSFPNYSYTLNLPLGTHRYIITVTDDCGNSTTTERIFTVYDCYVPALVCRADRIYNLQPLLEEGDIDGDGIVEEAAVLVEAVDLARCNFQDCSGELSFSLNRVGEPYNIEQTSLFLDCEDRYQVDLEVYVWDEAFNPFAVQPDGTVGGRNWRRCVVRVRLQDPNLVCNDCGVLDNVTVNGSVHTYRGQPMEGVRITPGDGVGASVTNRFGSYQLGLVAGRDYVLRASKDFDPREGLSTSDLILLQRYLHGYDTLGSSYLRLAADLNRDGNISGLDMLHLQALILGRENLYPSGSPWRFVEAKWQEPNPVAEEILLPAITECAFDHDFIGVRLGDLDESLGADAGAVQGTTSSAGRAARPRSLSLEDHAFRAGETFTVALRLADAAAYAGGQAELFWNKGALEYLGMTSHDLDPRRNALRLDRSLRFNWAQPLTTDEVMTLEFRAHTTGQLRDFLRLVDDAAFRDAVYQADLSAHPLYLSWAAPTSPEPSASGGSAEDMAPVETLLGVLPNPVRTTTRIGVYLPQEQAIRLTITDLSGRNIYRVAPRLAAGEHWLNVDATNWPAGVYLYTVRTAAGAATGKLLVQ